MLCDAKEIGAMIVGILQVKFKQQQQIHASLLTSYFCAVPVAYLNTKEKIQIIFGRFFYVSTSHIYYACVDLDYSSLDHAVD